MKKSLLVLGLCLITSFAMAAAVGDFTSEVSLGDDSGQGTAKFANGVYTITACGSDIWNNADGLYWIYKEISGNWMITVDAAWDETLADRINAVNAWRKMGLMVRVEPEEAGSVNVMALMENTLGTNLQYRSEKDGASAEVSGSLVTKTASDTDTLRLVRAGKNFTLLRKTTDGTFRTTHSLVFPVDMPAKVYYGFAVTSHDTSNIEGAKFSNLKVEPITTVVEGSRTLPQTTFLPGSVVNNIVLNITVEAGKTADVVVTEVLPKGWSIKTASPAITKMDGQKAIWELKGASGTKKITYSLDCGPDREGVILSGMISSGGIDFGITGLGGLDLEGADQAWAPKLATSTKLDGVISKGEYDGAYTFMFDRTNDRAPGVWINGKVYTFDQSHATVYVFHNDKYINIGIDMVDPSVEYKAGTNLWDNDSVELYVDGNYSISNPKENAEYGFQATVAGDGHASGGNGGPTASSFGAGMNYGEADYKGGYSTDGAYWNFGALANANGTGYVVEYQVEKATALDPVDISLVGFDIGVNENDAGSTARTGKWAWWHFNADTGGRMDAWNDERGWGKLELLKGAALPGVSEWSMF